MSFSCSKCDNKSYKSKSALALHTRKEHENIRYQCIEIFPSGEVCGKFFKEKRRRDGHVKEVHLGLKRKTNKATCPECGDIFQDNNKMEGHRDALHNTGREYPCKECNDFIGKTQNQRLNHVNSKHKKKFTCGRCSRGFASKQNLQTHFKNPKNECQPPEEIETAKLVLVKKRKFESANAASDFLDQVAEQLKNFMTDSTPTTPEGTRKCYHNTCFKTSIGYGEVGGDFISCKDHKKPDHKYLSGLRLCIYKGCKTRGHVTIQGCSSKCFCKSHSELLVTQGLPEEFVNKPRGYDAICSVDTCEVVATFDDKTYCFRHSPTKKSDNKRRCEHEECLLRPTFGFPDKSPTRCREHKEEGMFSRKLCEKPGCFVGANYGPLKGVAISCVEHKNEHYVLNYKECALACCMYGGPQPRFYHPDHEDPDSEFFEKRICHFGRRVLIEDALMDNNDAKVKDLLRHFGSKSILTLNAQSAFRVECEKQYYDLLNSCVEVVFDDVVHGGPKVLGDQRPDIFYKWSVNDQDFGIHIEYDEESGHEDDQPRLERIAKESGCEDRVYVIRVNGGHSTKNPLCKPVLKTHYKYYKVSESGKEVCREVVERVKERIGWIEQGLSPNSGPRLSKIVV